MRILKKFLVVLLSLVAIFGSALSAEAAKKVVAVMPLENVYGRNAENVADIMTEEIMVAVMKSGRYSVVERDQMATILREQGFQNIAADSNTAVEIGKLTGADYSLVGKVTMVSLEKNIPHKIVSKILDNISGSSNRNSPIDTRDLKGFVHELKSTVTVDVRLVNNETGELIFAKSFTGVKTGANPETALYAACKETANKFLLEITSNLAGRVADVSGDEIYIDLGIESGLSADDLLVIVRETSPIEVNGKIVSMKTVPVGRAKVTEVNADYSIGKIISTEKGKSVQKGDVVKRG